MALTNSRDERRIASVSDSLKEYGRGMAGGLLFSLPLIYTMEVWWTGFIAGPVRLMIALVATYVLLLGYNRFAGLHEDSSFAEVAADSMEELGIGLILATFVLWLIGRITSQMPPEEIAGKVIVEALTVAIGVSVGTAQLGASKDPERKEEGPKPPSVWNTVVLSLCGAVLVASNVAPTDEILVLSIENSSFTLLGIMVLSILLTGGILYYVDFTEGLQVSDERPLAVMQETTITYAVALASSAALLWFFGRFEDTVLVVCIGQTVVLAFPAALGGSAGRLLIK